MAGVVHRAHALAERSTAGENVVRTVLGDAIGSRASHRVRLSRARRCASGRLNGGCPRSVTNAGELMPFDSPGTRTPPWRRTISGDVKWPTRMSSDVPEASAREARNGAGRSVAARSRRRPRRGRHEAFMAAVCGRLTRRSAAANETQGGKECNETVLHVNGIGPAPIAPIGGAPPAGRRRLWC